MADKKYQVYVLETVKRRGLKTDEESRFIVDDITEQKKTLGDYVTLEEAARGIVSNTVPDSFEIVPEADSRRLMVYGGSSQVCYGRNLTGEEENELSKQLLRALSEE